MKKIVFAFAFLAFAFASVCEAGPIRRIIAALVHPRCHSHAADRPQVFADCPCGQTCPCPEGACPAACPVEKQKCPDGNCPLPQGVIPRPVLAPIPAPAEEDDEADDQPKDDHPNFGVDWSKIEDHKVSLTGRVITCEQAFERVSAGIPDDASKLRLVVIGTPEERKPVLDMWAKLEGSMKDRLLPWSVDKDNFSLTDTTTGKAVFYTDGHPTIYVQATDGKVLHRQDEFKAGDNFTAIRKAVKAYDAAKDPKGTTPAGANNHALLLLGAGAAAFMVYHARKKD